MNGMKSPECSDTMKITILGPAHPYRGGLASIMEIMARTFQRRGDEVDIKTFTLQYPSLLFPGESQTVATPPPADLRICRCVNTMNPLNWVRVGRRIRRERPDFVLMKYWTPFMAPCFGTIARIARGNGHTKVLCQIDNVEPHEHHLTDKPFNRYYLHSVDGFVYMSEQVHSELRAYSDAPALFSPHPLFENFGERVERSEACVRLGLDKAAKMAALAGPKDILFSVHAPYYISMSSLEEEKRLNSIQYLLQSAAVCKALGGRRIIFHSGSCGKQSREAALEKALDTMRRAVEALDEAGFADMTLCPETMGKIGQLGTLDEVLALCSVDKRITPCIDFGHLNARTLGGIRSKEDYAAILSDDLIGKLFRRGANLRLPGVLADHSGGIHVVLRDVFFLLA